MKRPRGGSLYLVLTPDELLARMATLVPPPRTHALRYHGVFAPNSKHRRRVGPAPERSDPAGGSARSAARPLGPAASPEPRRDAEAQGDYAGYFSIRINDQYRTVFRFERSDARAVQIVDYH